MDTFAHSSVRQLGDLGDRPSVNGTTDYMQIWAQNFNRSTIETPLCDGLVDRGVLPIRTTKPYREPGSTPASENCSRTGLHTAISELIEQRNAVRASNSQTPVSKPLLHPPSMKSQIHFPPLSARHDTMAKDAAHPRMGRPRRTSSAVLRQYLSLLDSFKGVFLSCSTTLASCSSEIVRITKVARKVQDKKFSEYFGFV